MEPHVQYCTTSDGVAIAYWAIGSGPPLVDCGTPPATHLRLEWQIPEMRAWYERLASQRTLVRFDGRGSGLSERDIDDFSIDAMVRDLEAVVSAAKLERFALLGGMNAGVAALTFAARHPDEIEALILWCAYSRGSEFFDDSGTRMLREMADRDWHMFTESASGSRFGWAHGEHAARFAALWREAVTPRTQGLVMDRLREVDVTDLLPRIKAPTLVLQREARGADVARRLGAAIPDARVAIFEGVSAATYHDDDGAIWRTLAEFLGIPVASTPSPAVESVRTILFTDVESNTALLQRLGDDAWRSLLRTHERITRDLLAAHGGVEVKTMGDGFMAWFSSPARALDCAIALQRAFGGGAVTEWAAEELRLRIGLNTGEPIVEDGDLFGTAVTLAARISAEARGGEILVPEVVRHLVAGKGFRSTERGEFLPKGFDGSVRLFSLEWSAPAGR
jgi:class 3 adenylate cyclase